jgi:DNA invertase Pin-like site-specific DNA recombinase
MQAFISLRVSTKRQEREGISLSDGDDPGIQERKCRELCALRDWEVAGVYRDAASGRSLKNRDGIAQAVRAACANKGVVVFYSVSRCGRSTRDVLNIVHSLHEAKAHIASATEQQIDTSSPMGMAFFQFTAVLAELESNQKSAWAAASHDLLKKKLGYTPLAPQPYGWMLIKGTHNRIRIPAQQLTLAKIHAMRASRASDSIIARELNAIGTPAPRGGIWYSSTVERVRRQAKEAEKAERKAQRATVNASS